MAFVNERVRIFGFDGSAVGDIDVAVQRTYLLNDEGSAEFLMSVYDGKCTPEYIKIGNRLLVENEKLPSWVGVINRVEWNDFHIRVECKSAERLFKWRRGISGLKLTGTAGEIFIQMVRLMNLQHPSDVRVGNIYRDGNDREETLGTNPLFQNVQRVSNRSQNDWDVTPIVKDDGSLDLLANWYEQEGTERLISIEQGFNVEMESPVMIQDGDEIINDLLGYNQAANAGSRLEYVLNDIGSAGRYDWREGALSFDVKTIGSLQSAVKATLNQRKWSREAYHATLLDVNDLFSNVRLGDIFPLSLYRTGFSAGGLGMSLNIRLLGLAYDPLNPSRMPVVIQKVN